MEVSLELVPRSGAALEAGLMTVEKAENSRICFINIPDLSRFSIRSWEACGMIQAAGAGGGLGLIPHLRARDFSLHEPFPLAGFFDEHRISRALVIAGDPKAGEEDGPPATVAFIKKLKAELPGLEIFAAFDPYRTNIRYELDYLKAKEEAGAAGFMSQPFFDLRLLEIYAEYLEGKQVFWGVSPVLSPSSRLYWESRNRAIFPRHFEPSLDWNVDYGKKVMAFCETWGFSLYLMPIKIDLDAYLSRLFGREV